MTETERKRASETESEKEREIEREMGSVGERGKEPCAITAVVQLSDQTGE